MPTVSDTDDPFACFGDDDDDEDSDVRSDQGGNADNVGEPVATRKNARGSCPDAAFSADRDRGRLLAETYNAAEGDPSLHAHLTEITRDTNDDTLACHSSYEEQRSRTSTLPWPYRPPLYFGPARLSRSLAEGGGRGYVAIRDLLPGTCVLVEEPLVEGWGEDQVGRHLGLESVCRLFEMEKAQDIVGCMEELHPRRERVDDVFRDGSRGGSSASMAIDLDRVQILDMISGTDGDRYHVNQVKALVAYAEERGITNSDGSSLEDRDVERLFLTLRYNCFESGLYLHFSMFNHDEDPNCVKFRPSREIPARRGCYSEARTTRHVRRGEALTLHYLENPREVSHVTRRKILWDQHRFDIGDEHSYKRILGVTVTKMGHLFDDNERGYHIFESELVSGNFPPSSREGIGGKAGDAESEVPITLNIEKSLDDLEDMHTELREIFEAKSNGSAADRNHFDRAAALELTAWELATASQPALGNNHHILLSRCRRFHLDAVELLLSYCALNLTVKQSVNLMARFLPSARQLLESQLRRLGGNHPDVARTYDDLSMAIQALLSHSPKRIPPLKLAGMETLDRCSKMESRCRAEKKRIEAMYPKDVDQILNSVQKTVFECEH